MTINPNYDHDNYNKHVFEASLPRTQKTEIWKFEYSADAEKLQNLFNKATSNKDNPIICKKHMDKYQRTLDKLQKDGKREFTLTRGRVYELVDDPEHKTLEVPIRVQVKEGVLTWYFSAPMDQTKQSFRDEVFLSAGLAQIGVDDACFRYLRGTNSLHVKKMHTQENESLMNHNHYILDEGKDYTPKQFKQHLDGFVKAERELTDVGIIINDSEIEKFLTQEEADMLVQQYTKHWEEINFKSDPDKASELEEKKQLGKKRLTKADKNEWVKYNQQLNSIISSGYEKDNEGHLVRVKDGSRESETYLRKNDHFTINPNWSLKHRIAAVKDAMRGGYSNRAQVRQIAGSILPALPEITKMNDAVKIESNQVKVKENKEGKAGT